MTVAKIAVLPDDHVKFAWETASGDFREAMRFLSSRIGVTPKVFFKAVLQCMYNVHIRAREQLPRSDSPLSTAALPIVGAHGEVFLGASARDANVLSLDLQGVRAHLAMIEAEKGLKGKDRILHAAIFHASRARKSYTFISVHEQHVAEAIGHLLKGQHPDRLASIIAWETFLGYGASKRQQYKLRFQADRSLGKQVEIEKRTGADKFRKKFPEVSRRFMREDFAPLLRMVERRA